MRPERTKIVNGDVVAEFYWNSELVCYVNHNAVSGTFDEICNALEEGVKLKYWRR